MESAERRTVTPHPDARELDLLVRVMAMFDADSSCEVDYLDLGPSGIEAALADLYTTPLVLWSAR